MDIIAIIATYNEERFIAGCIENLKRQGVQVYLIDNDSVDATVQIADRFDNVIGIENFPRKGNYHWKPILKRKEELAFSLSADWFMHVDADERHLPPSGYDTLGEAINDIDRRGYTAIHSYEFSFIPTLEHPDHDHPDFEKTMRWYYHFAPHSQHLMRAWQKQPVRVDISSTGGHQVASPKLNVCPEHFLMKHYIFLSKEHAIQKYVKKEYNRDEVKGGWHVWRSQLVENVIDLPSEKKLKKYISNSTLDVSDPWRIHWLKDRLDKYKEVYSVGNGRI